MPTGAGPKIGRMGYAKFETATLGQVMLCDDPGARMRIVEMRCHFG